MLRTGGHEEELTRRRMIQNSSYCGFLNQKYLIRTIYQRERQFICGLSETGVSWLARRIPKNWQDCRNLLKLNVTSVGKQDICRRWMRIKRWKRTKITIVENYTLIKDTKNCYSRTRSGGSREAAGRNTLHVISVRVLFNRSNVHTWCAFIKNARGT